MTTITSSGDSDLGLSAEQISAQLGVKRDTIYKKDQTPQGDTRRWQQAAKETNLSLARR